MRDTVKQSYRLVELQCTNFKAIKAVAIRTDRTVIQVAGRNAQGKSSLLDAVAAAIGGKEAFPREPIRKGEDKAEIFLDFGGLKLTRRIWHKEGGGVGHSVTVEYADGKRPRSPQDVLDELRGSPIADDPIAFSRLKPKERYDLLKQLVPDFDFDTQATARRDLFDERTQAGREFDRAKGAADSIMVPPDAPLAPVDVTEMAAKLREAGEHNALVDTRAKRREEAADELERWRDRADKLAAELKTLNVNIAERERMISATPVLPDKIDTLAIEQQIMDAETTNAAARKRTEKISKQAEADALETKYESLTQRIAVIDKAKAHAIESAKLPIKELTFGDDDILLDGLPFDQASTARKIRVSTALLMALKPELRVLLVREGSLLDDDARAALEADAEKNGFVVLMEVVGPGDGGGGVTIEDGEIV